MRSSEVEAQMMISFKYTRKRVQVGPLSSKFIDRVKLAGPFVNPKGTTLEWNCP